MRHKLLDPLFERMTHIEIVQKYFCINKVFSEYYAANFEINFITNHYKNRCLLICLRKKKPHKCNGNLEINVKVYYPTKFKVLNPLFK